MTELRFIGPADIEFYEAKLVLTVAQSMVPPGKTWDDLGHRAKQRRLDQAVKSLATLLNDVECMDRLVRSHRDRALKAD
jgi:hypothetical protein